MSLGGLDALFNPAKRHMEEEKLRLQSTREEAGDSSGGRRIDLDSGKVRIRKSGRSTAPEPPAAENTLARAEATSDSDSGTDSETDPGTDSGTDSGTDPGSESGTDELGERGNIASLESLDDNSPD